MMAWVRTATSLISFGFTIYKFFQFDLKDNPNLLGEPRGYAVAMISTGIVSLAVAAVAHLRSMNELREEFGPIPPSLAAALGLAIGALGIVALFMVWC